MKEYAEEGRVEEMRYERMYVRAREKVCEGTRESVRGHASCTGRHSNKSVGCLFD